MEYGTAQIGVCAPVLVHDPDLEPVVDPGDSDDALRETAWTT
jgi:hypothetical protein